jgi:hypothetical protein
MAATHQISFSNDRLAELPQHPPTVDHACLPAIKKVLVAQKARIQELMHLNIDAGVVYVASPPLGVMSTPQPALSSMFSSSTAAVHVHYTSDGYTIIQAPQSPPVKLVLTAPTGPHPHYYPVSYARWEWYVLAAAKQELHQLWEMQGNVTAHCTSLQQLLPEGETCKSSLHCGRFHASYTVPLDAKGKADFDTWLASEQSKVVQCWRDILKGVDTSSHDYQRARLNILDFMGPPGGDQCEVARSNREFERSKREDVANGTADVENDSRFMVHCSIARDEDCDCAAVAQKVLPDE